MRKKLWFAALLLLAGILLLAAAGADGTVELSYTVSFEKEMARAVFPMVNAFRAEEGVWCWNSDNSVQEDWSGRAPLTYDYGLERVAMLRAAECAVCYAHTRPDGSRCFTLYPSGGGMAENIAAGYSSAESVFNGWREENASYSGQGHRRNMLGNYKCIGIGCVISNGICYWAQAFSTEATGESETTLSPERTVTASVDTLFSSSVSADLRDLASAESEVSVKEGESCDLPVLTAVCGWWRGTDVTVSGASWSPADSLVTVAGGKMTGAAGGKTSITASVGSLSATVPVTVICARHTWDAGETVTAATCTEEGSVLHTCRVCGSTETEAVAALGHSWREPVYTWSEDNLKVRAKHVCSRDESHSESETVRATAVETAAATCTEPGERVWTSAAFDNAAFAVQTKTEVIPALGHDWRAEFTWTGTESCTAVLTCGRDASHQVSLGADQIAITSEVTTEPGNTTEGVLTWTATAVWDGETFTDSKTEAIPQLMDIDAAGVLRAYRGTASKIEIPKGVTAIGDKVFRKMTRITQVTVPSTVKTIGKSAFNGCTKLKAVKGGAGVVTVADNAFYNCKALKTVPTLSRLQTVGAGAFRNCIKLTKITLGSKVKSIGKSAFQGCKALKTVTVKTTKLKSSSVGAAAFKSIYKKAVFKCPKSKLSTYKKLFVKKGAPKTCTFR